MAATAKVIQIKGDKKNPESAEHIIEFPGGSISVCRTSDQKYWAHVYVNNKEKIDDTNMHSKIGKIEKIRDFEDNHWAILISTE